ncbi:MAG TPA: ABC transporter substrate-binding protein [Acidimicrobiales bacterium]|nr:ABC transporter substrate-binding protein [Acidimicrobiales bacterium]
MGGTLSIAESPGGGPTYILPIVPAADDSVGTVDGLVDYMWRSLWWAPLGYAPTIDWPDSISPAPPKFSDDDKVATITLRSNWKWSDGQPVTSTDVAFYCYLAYAAVVLSPDNDGSFTPGEFPQDLVSVATPSPTTAVITLSKSFNPTFQFLDQLATITPLPAHAWSKTRLNGPIINFRNLANAEAIYKFLNAESSELSTYGSDPLWQVVDGPYRIKSFDPSTDGNVLVANPNYSGPVKPHITTIDDVAFTSTEAEFDELLSGNLDVGFVDFSDLQQVPRLKSLGYDVWGYPDFGNSFIVYNFKDRTGDFDNIISQLYIRQALAHLQDEQGVISARGMFDGAAGAAYGPVPAIPKSPFAPPNALKNPYPYSISTALRLLSSHGWKVVPDGTTTCAKAGTGPNECGAGIPAGTPLTWNLVYASQPAVIGAQCEAIASAAKLIGISINLQAKTFNYIISELSDPADPDHDGLWAMQDYGGDTDVLYPTQDGIFNTTGSFNTGDYSNPTYDSLVNDSLHSDNPDAVLNEISFLTEQLPGMFQPNPDLITAFSNKLAGPASSFQASSQYQYMPEYWYFTKH